MIENWRTYALVIILILGIIDLTLTYVYVSKYKTWQPEKPYKLIENNPLLVFLWNNMGFTLGMIVGFIIILSLQYIVVKSAWWPIVLILFLVLCWVMYNHYNNFHLLNQLIEKYPSGYLPEEVFGKVVGNNLK